MKTQTGLMLAGLLLIAATAALAAPQIEGVFGLAPVPAGAALAVWVPVGDGETVAGVRWYHNDGEQAFPELLAVAGVPDRPDLLPQAVVVATEVGAESSAWNELAFARPLATVTGGLYLVFRLPVGGDFAHAGTGGGAGLGYLANEGEGRCWLPLDGTAWHPLSADHQAAVVAVMDAGKRGDALVLGYPGSTAVQPAAAEPVAGPLAASLQAVPNPFNPQTEVRFTLPAGGDVVVAIYDVRGALVAWLHRGPLPAGEHRLVWDGRDDAGRAQPSGVYVARLTAGSLRLSCRLTLVQ